MATLKPYPWLRTADNYRRPAPQPQVGDSVREPWSSRADVRLMGVPIIKICDSRWRTESKGDDDYAYAEALGARPRVEKDR